ncbi:MAG: 50S ribosomal protein L18 [Planctomycetes bacterium]|nr:50S ribosomal protein L18 [Planctomycetota bacterium]
MEKNKLKSVQKTRRAYRTRNRQRAAGTRPRLSVFRSARHIAVQIIDDAAHKTLVAATSHGKKADIKSGGNIDGAKAIGKKIAELALAKGIKQVAFDRGPYKYHGRIKALADAAREAGLEF